MNTLYYAQQYASKTLNGAIDDSQTTGITLSNSTGLDIAVPGIVALSWSDPLNTTNVEWVSYTSINGSSVLQEVTRGAEGSTAKAHSNGAVVAFPITESHINNLNINVAALYTGTIEFIIDGGGATITTGIKGDLQIPFGCTITKATALADQSGSIVVDVWKDTYANFPPTDADSITASAPITISTATKSEDSTLTGWTTSISSGNVLRFNVDSVTTIQRVTLILNVTRV